MRDKKGAVISQTIAWVVATVAIFFIIMIFFISSIFLSPQKPSFEESESNIGLVKSIYTFSKLTEQEIESQDVFEITNQEDYLESIYELSNKEQLFKVIKPC